MKRPTRYTLLLTRRALSSAARFRAAFYGAGLPAALEPAFALTPSERRFALQLSRRHTQLWVFRSNQKLFCGDFAIVDMSPRVPDVRRCVVAELKHKARLRRTRGWQCKNADHAAAEIAETTGAIGESVRPEVLTGESDDVFRAITRAQDLR